ncbi:hypothetical protein HQ489_05295 [Candidatus Woesearchaeota archaeon]|nr:hypothetical protein [Candidatus Woesearchaeota archaeon]
MTRKKKTKSGNKVLKFLWNIIKFFFRILKNILVWCGKIIYESFSAGVKKTKNTIHEVQKEASISKNPPEYKKIKVFESVEGDFKDFEYRLNNKSLIITIAGRRGSGKSTLAFKIMENILAKNDKRIGFAMGVKQSLLPAWIKTITSIEDVGNNGVLVVDEGAISFGSRNSMSKKNKGLGELLAIARHKDITLLLITQNTSMIDKNVLNLCDSILLKEGSLLQDKMERSAIKSLYTKVVKKFKSIDKKERIKFFYIYDDDFEGMCHSDLPSFWNENVSKNQA